MAIKASYFKKYKLNKLQKSQHECPEWAERFNIWIVEKEQKVE